MGEDLRVQIVLWAANVGNSYYESYGIQFLQLYRHIHSLEDEILIKKTVYLEEEPPKEICCAYNM